MQTLMKRIFMEHFMIMKDKLPIMVHPQWYCTSWAKLMQTNPKQFTVYYVSTYITEHIYKSKYKRNHSLVQNVFF